MFSCLTQININIHQNTNKNMLFSEITVILKHPPVLHSTTRKGYRKSGDVIQTIQRVPSLTKF